MCTKAWLGNQKLRHQIIMMTKIAGSWCLRGALCARKRKNKWKLCMCGCVCVWGSCLIVVGLPVNRVHRCLKVKMAFDVCCCHAENLCQNISKIKRPSHKNNTLPSVCFFALFVAHVGGWMCVSVCTECNSASGVRIWELKLKSKFHYSVGSVSYLKV